MRNFLFGQRVLRAGARLWWLNVYNSNGHLPIPRDAPSIRSGRIDADRVLLVGNGAAGGWMVATYGLALAGQLAAAVQRATGRGCDLDQVGDEVMNVRSAPSWIGKRTLVDYDVVVVVLGMSDAVRLTSASEWRAGLTGLLEKLLRDTRDGARVVMTGIEPVHMSRVFRGPYAMLAQRNADRLNEITRELASTYEQVDYVDLLEPDPGAGVAGPGKVYASWATTLTSVVTAALNRAPARPQGESLPALPVRGTPVSPGVEWDQIKKLLERAKSEFRADVAWISTLDGDRVTIPVASIGNSPAEVPLDLTFCAHTMQQDGTMVIPNAKRDPRFRGNPFLEVVHFEFYAGHRLEDATGATIGTFCVASIRPRRASAINLHTFADYAQKAETELALVQDAAVSEPLTSTGRDAAKVRGARRGTTLMP
jgi:hypothetical protein